MAMGKGLVLMLAAMTMSLMFVASATSPLLNGFNPSGHQASGKDPAIQDDSSKTPYKAGVKGTAKDGTKCCKEKAPLNDASGLSVLRGKVLDMKTGAPVAGALVVLQPVNAGADMKADPARPVEDTTSFQSAGCEKKEDSGGSCGTGTMGNPQPGPDANLPPIQPPKPPIVPVPQPVLQTKADAKGVYSIQIKPGDFILNVMAEGYLPFFGEVGVPKATKFDHDVALAPAPVPDCRIEGTICSAADGKRLPGVNVLIIRLPADLPLSDEALKEMVGRYLGEKPAEPGMTPEQIQMMNEKEAQRQDQDADGQLTDEQVRLMREKLAQEQNTDTSGQLTDEQKEQIIQEIEGVKARMALQQELEKKASEELNSKAPQNCCPGQPPESPVPPLPKDPVGMFMPEQITLMTDQKGHFEAKLFSGRVLIIAFARGYDPQWALLDLPSKSSISIQLKLDLSLSQGPILVAPVREPPTISDQETPDTSPNPR